MLSAANRIQTSLSKLSRKFLGLSGFIEGLPVEHAPHLAVAGTDGSRLMFNFDHVDLLDDDQLDGLVMHEIIHVIDMHAERAANKNLILWNSACDLRSNYIVRSVQMRVPQGTANNAAYDGMNVDSIYGDLLSQYRRMRRQFMPRAKAINGKLRS